MKRVITASKRKPKWYDTRFACKVIDAYNEGSLTYDNIDEWETAYNGGIAPKPSLGTEQILDYYLETGIDPRD